MTMPDKVHINKPESTFHHAGYLKSGPAVSKDIVSKGLNMNGQSNTQNGRTTSNGNCLKSSHPEPEWVGLSRKLCAKFAEGHIEDHSTGSCSEEPRGMSTSLSSGPPPQHNRSVHKLSTPSTPVVQGGREPPWIPLSRKLCNKFIEEHIEHPPLVLSQGSAPAIPNGDSRIIEKVGNPKPHGSKAKKETEPEWVNISRKLRAKFIESHFNDSDTMTLDNQLNASDLEETNLETSDAAQDVVSHTVIGYRSSNLSGLKGCYQSTDFEKHKLEKNIGFTKYSPQNVQSVLNAETFLGSDCCWEYQKHKTNKENTLNCNRSGITEGNSVVLNENVFHSKERNDTKSFAKNNTNSIEFSETGNVPKNTLHRNSYQQCEYKNIKSQQNDVQFAPLTIANDKLNERTSNSKKIITIEIVAHPGNSLRTFCDNRRSPLKSADNSPSKNNSFFNLTTWDEAHCKTDKSEHENDIYIKKDVLSKSVNDLQTCMNDNRSTSSLETNSKSIREGKNRELLPKDHCLYKSDNSLHRENYDYSSGRHHYFPTDNKCKNKNAVLMEHQGSSTSEHSFEEGYKNEQTTIVLTEHFDSLNDNLNLKHKSAEKTDWPEIEDSNDYGIISQSELDAIQNKPITDFHSSQYAKVKCNNLKINGKPLNSTFSVLNEKHFQNNETFNKDGVNKVITDSSNKEQTCNGYITNHHTKVSKSLKDDLRESTITSDVFTEYNPEYYKSDNEREYVNVKVCQNSKGLKMKSKSVQSVCEQLFHKSVQTEEEYLFSEDEIVKKKSTALDDQTVSGKLMVVKERDTTLSKNALDLKSPLKTKSKSMCDISNQSTFPPSKVNEIKDESHTSSPKSTLKSEVRRVPSLTFQDFKFESEIPLCAKLISKSDKHLNSLTSSSYGGASPVSETSHVYEDMFKETTSGPSDSETSSWKIVKNNSYYINGRSSSMNDLDYSDSCSMSVKCDYASSGSGNSTLQSRHSSCNSSSFYVNLRDYDSHMLEPSLSKKKKSKSSTKMNGNTNNVTISNPPTPESLRHLFASPLNPIHSLSSTSDRIVNRIPSDSNGHYYSTVAATSSAFKHGFDPGMHKPKKADRSSSLKIKDIAQGIILTFRKLQNHAKMSHLSSSSVDVSHLAEFGSRTSLDSSKAKVKADSTKEYNKMEEKKKWGIFENGKNNSDSVYPSTTRRSSSDASNKKSSFDVFSSNKTLLQQNGGSEKKKKSAKKNSNSKEKGKKGRSKSMETRTVPTVSRKVQQMADGTLYLVTTVSGDTTVPGVYSDSPDTASELSEQRPAKLTGESNC